MTRTVSQTINLYTPDQTSTYITYISAEGGIKVHNANDLLNYVKINSDGLEVFKNEISIANFGTTARIGSNNSSRFLMNSNSLEAYNENNNKYFKVNANELTWGTNTAATTTQVSNAEKTATSYITYVNATDGIKVHSVNDTINYAKINSNGLQVYKNDTLMASFGTSVQIGSTTNNTTRMIIQSSGLDFITKNSSGTDVNMAHIGYENVATSSTSTGESPYYTFGRRRTAETIIGGYSFTAGYANSASGYNSISLGTQNINYGNVTIGRYNKADDALINNSSHFNECYIFGENNEGTGLCTLIGRNNSGYNSTTKSQDCYAFGNGNEVAHYGYALGVSNTSIGNASFVFGKNNETSANNSILIGFNCESTGSDNVSIGTGIKTTNTCNYAIGLYNFVPNSSNSRLFCIGNGGDDDSRSNCVEIDLSGNIYAASYKYLSDERIKTNFKSVFMFKNMLMELEPIDYEWTKLNYDGQKNLLNDKKRHFGLKAQHTQKILKKYGYENYGLVDKGEKFYTISYAELIPVCIKVIQEQEEEINLLKSKLDNIEILLKNMEDN